jgi:exodeoxyribonuclease VII small subunit
MTKKSFSLEKNLKRLEEILQILESGEKDIEESIGLFEEGLRISTECQKHLQDLEKRVKILVEKEDGRIQEQDFIESAGADAAKTLFD